MSQARDLVDSLVDTTRSGRIIQVQRTQYTSTTSTAVATYTNVELSHLAVNITLQLQIALLKSKRW